jgi:hypothetical protein
MRLARGKSSLGPNTYLRPEREYVDPAGRKHTDVIQVVLYRTPILTFLRDGRVILNCGGHRTRTTQGRLNAVGPVQIYQKNHKWYVSDPHWWKDQLFFDGYTVGDQSEEYALLHAANQGDDLARKAWEDYLEERR